MSAVGPEVSVILPVYNGERFLREAMESLLSQTFPDFEVVAVDDGSTDRSRAILEEYALKDGRVRVISRLNTGVVGALNDALRAACGSLVARMDADDVCLPRRLEAQTRFLREHPDYVLVGGRIIMMDPDGIPIREECPPRDHEEIDARHLRGEFTICSPAAMMRREVVLDAGLFSKEYQSAEDLDLWLRLGERGRIASIDELVLRYRVHFGGMTLYMREEQARRARRAVMDAHRRRGLSEPAAPQSPPHISNPPGTTASWALGALESRWYGSALRLAAKAVRKYPRSPQPWIALGCALLGPVGRLLAPTLLRWRELRRARVPGQ